MSRRLALALYRGTLRAASGPGAATLDAREVRGALGAVAAEPVATSPRSLVRQLFRAQQGATGTELRAALATGAAVLVELNKRNAAFCGDTFSPKPPAILHSVGHVFTHRIQGWKGIVVGYDERCRASPEWVKRTGADQTGAGLLQPFYHVLVDQRDRKGSQVAYVAQENVAPLAAAGAGQRGASASPADAFVLHGEVPRFFRLFDVNTGAYVPTDGLEQLYPDDCFTTRSFIASVRERTALMTPRRGRGAESRVRVDRTPSQGAAAASRAL